MKKSNELFSEIIDDVYSSRGAPMGRSNIGSIEDATGRIFDRKIALYDGAYDKGGAYWGCGDTLRVAYSSCGKYVEFYRGRKKKIEKITVYDNGGKTFDRYTVIIGVHWYAMSYSGDGFNQYVGEDGDGLKRGRHLGKKLDSIPENLKSAVNHLKNI